MLELAGPDTAGVDEVGRGPLAGPVVAAAVILGPDHGISGLRDSKCLKPARREALALQIRRQARAWCISYASAWEIDRLNILQASLLAMHRAVQRLPIQPMRVLVDGNRAPVWPYACETVIGGDDRVDAIAAASILAKTARDWQMLALAACYPGYGFERHMGYPTPAHKAALQYLGPCPAHRQSFAPVRACQAANHHQPDGSGKLA
ncbi:ribonuclease HII [Thermithiobacillus plumbiphilus]|uniref:Ribonuclease HII n=1 Tax=Thermithiobacillus plumbiphilus TaxID=1729899 RepID=A0ABU9D3P6_9PROT